MRLNFKRNTIALRLFTRSLPVSSFLEFLVWTIISLPLLFFSTHILLISQEYKELSRYSENILSRGKQVSFQLHNSLSITSNKKTEVCSNEDLDNMRGFLSHYHYLEDLGRIEGNKILCTAVWGKLSKAKILPDSNSHSHKVEHYWKPQKDLFVKGENRAIYALGNTMAIISPSAFFGIHRISLKSGAVIYSYDKNFIYKKLGDITKHETKEIFQRKNKISDWLPLPEKSIYIKNCIKKYDICVAVIDSRLGLFELSSIIIIFLFFIAIILGYISFWFKDYIFKIKHSLKFRFNLAVENHMIYPLYQPKINLTTKQITGVEALARWDDELLGRVSPDIFISLAEETKKINELTRNITRKTLYETKEILRERKKFTVSINLSVQDLINDDFLDFIENEISIHQINPRQIIFEITERSASESEVMVSSIKKLTNCGYQISLDDFGTGFSNLAWLSKFEPNEIKIDKMFIQSISTESVGKITFNSICQLLENYDVTTVFEGIETREEMDYILIKSPNAIGQGWLMSKACSIEEIKALLKKDTIFE